MEPFNDETDARTVSKHFGPNTGGTCNAVDPEYAQRAIADRLHELFSYHRPTEDQLPKYQAIRTAAKNFAETILNNTPPGADQSDALRKVREAMMTANAAIALNGRS